MQTIDIKNRISRFIFTLMILASSQARAEAEEISWVLLNFPPLMRLDLNKEGETNMDHASGPMAELQRELVKALPQYKHRYQVVSFRRAKKLFESKGGFCTILFLENKDRSEYLYFGDSIATTIPPGLITHRKNEARLNVKPGSYVDLEQLLKTQDFQLGVVNGRSFSPRIDEAMGGSRKPVYQMVINEAMGSLFKMLNSERVDGVLAYYLELAEEQERNPASRDLQFYQLKQDHTSISLPVSCERSQWGKKTLGKVSLAVKDESVKAKLTALVKQTLLMDRPKRSEEPTPTLLR